MLLFNVEVAPERRTYWIENFHPVRLYNCGRYPAYSFALRTERMHELNLTYHLWFGGGARYSNGEDSLFIRDCIKKGMKVFAVPVTIGEEIPVLPPGLTAIMTSFSMTEGCCTTISMDGWRPLWEPVSYINTERRCVSSSPWLRQSS